MLCLQLRAAAKQALLRHKFLEARHILDEAVSLHPDSYKVDPARPDTIICSVHARNASKQRVTTAGAAPRSLLFGARFRAACIPSMFGQCQLV
jgi:hypothetical protein